MHSGLRLRLPLRAVDRPPLPYDLGWEKEGPDPEMQTPLALHHTLGYGGAKLHFAGDGSVLFACGTVVRRVSNDSSLNSAFSTDSLGVGTIAVHPSRESFAYCEKGKGAIVRICDMENGRVQEKIEGAGSIDVEVMSFTSDGSALVTVAGIPDFQITIWDWQKQTELVTGVAPARFSSGAFNPHNQDQICFLGDGALYACNVVAGASGPEFEFERIPAPSDDIAFISFAWSASGTLYCTTSDGCLWIADPLAGALVGESVVVSPDGGICHITASYSHILCWCPDGSLAWLSDDTLSEAFRIKIPVSPGDALVSLCAGESTVFAGGSDGSLYLVDLLQEIPDSMDRDEDDEPSPVTVKDLYAIVGEIHHDSHHRLSRLLLSHRGPINGLAPLPNLACVASAGSDGLMCMWETATGSLLAVQKCGRPLRKIVSHPTEPLVCVADDDGLVNVLDVSTPARLRAIFTGKLFTGAVTAMCVSMDGNMLAVGSSSSQHVYFLSLSHNTVKVVGFTAVPLRGVSSLAWNSRTTVIASGVHAFLFQIHNIPMVKPETDGLDLGLGLSCTRVFSTVRAMAFCTMGAACSFDTDRTIRVYSCNDWPPALANADSDSDSGLSNVPAGTPVTEWTDHDKKVDALCVFGEGNVLGSCGSDGLVMLRSGPELSMLYARYVFCIFVFCVCRRSLMRVSMSFTCIYTCVCCVCVCICVFVCMYVCVCIYIYIHMYTCMHA
jgi:WD40 repeat protein